MHPHLSNPAYTPPWWLRNGLAMTVHTAYWGSQNWEATTLNPEPTYQETIFTGAQGVPIYGWVAIPENPKGTIIGTYGITGSLDNQWFLRLLGRKAFAQGYAVVLFDWRAHGKTAQLSPTLTSDGLYEGEDFVRIAAQAKAMGCPASFWFTGFSLGGQLALWAVKAAQDLLRQDGESREALEQGSRGSKEIRRQGDKGIIPNSEFCLPLTTNHRLQALPPCDGGKQMLQAPLITRLTTQDIGGAAVICPSLDSIRSLSYLVKDPLGKYLEQAIARELKKLAWRIHEAHPGAIDPAAIERANSIWGFDRELVIGRLGFPSVEAYYKASSGLQLLHNLEKPTLIIYAADDPLFDPAIVPDLQAACNREALSLAEDNCPAKTAEHKSGDRNPHINLILTRYGGHVGYLSSKACQLQAGDPDPWWAWNRVLEWIAGGKKEKAEK